VGIVLILLALSPAELWQKMTRETNSQAAAKRGSQQYATGRFEESVQSFATVGKLAPNPRSLFNLGTSQVAAGQRSEGSTTLSKAMADPALRAAALYNRGNSALASNAYDHAIRDYTETLKLRPGDRDAKRNLEIALNRQQQAKQQQQRQQQQQGGGPKSPQAPPQPSPGGKKSDQKQDADQDAEALLRSVQQQEQEELARMKRARMDPKAVGW
jgi:Ca-activated chloride channel family protein